MTILSFVDMSLNRLSEKREDATYLSNAKQSGKTYILNDTHIFYKEAGNNPLFSISAEDTPVFLGERNNEPLFALFASEPLTKEMKEAGFLETDLRTSAINKLFDEPDLNALASAKALFYWHKTTKFCGLCGGEKRLGQAGWRRECVSCEAQSFPRTDPVVIMIAVDGEQCLLGRQSRFPAGVYSSLAGFMEPGETIENAVRREVFEEAGIETGEVKILMNQPWAFPGSLMIGCVAKATSQKITIAVDEIEDARWFTRDDCRKMLEKTHEEGFMATPPLSISHHLLKWFAEGGSL